MVGGLVSWTVTGRLQVVEQPFVLVPVSVKVRVWLQRAPAITLTVWPDVDPEIVPLPLMDQE